MRSLLVALMTEAKNLMNSFTSNNKIRILLIFFVSEVYLLIFSLTTSPLYDVWGGDSAFFILVGKAMKYGYLPYRDFYDMKGPYLFFLEYIGQVLHEDRLGAFIVQSILLFLSMVFFDKTISIGHEQRKVYDIVLLIPLFLTAIFSIGGGGMTEEFSLLPLAICLYYGTRFVYRKEDRHRPLYAGIYGFSFGFLALLRINNAAEICAVVLTIIIILITKGEWKNIFHNAIAFIAGFVLAVLPVVVFYAANDLLEEMLNQVFVYGIKYSGLSSEARFASIITGPYRTALFPIGVGLIAALLFTNKSNWGAGLLIWISSIATISVIALSGRNFEHYYGLLIPVIALDVWYIKNAVCEEQREKKKRIAVVCAVLFLLSYYGTCKLDKTFIINNIVAERDTSVDDATIDASAHIGEGSVYCWTPNPRWYSVADRFPSFKHCFWQTSQMEIDPNIADELRDMFINDPPDWLVLENNDSKLPEFVTQSKDDYFEETYKNDYWIVFKNSKS